MSDEIEVLENIYQNAKIEQEIIGNIVNRFKIEYELYSNIMQYNDDLKKIIISAKSMIQRRKKKIHEISILSKMATYVNVKNNITKEDSIENIANKLIQSSKVNINQFEEVLKEYNIKNKHVLNISNRYLNIQFNNIDRLEKIAK